MARSVHGVENHPRFPAQYRSFRGVVNERQSAMVIADRLAAQSL
jgi:hypothetical protein